MVRLAAPILLWLLSLAITLSGGWEVMWLLVYALGLLLLASLLWAQVTVSGLRLRRRRHAARLQVGDTLRETAVLEPRHRLAALWPRLWLEVHDHTTLPGHALDRVVSLEPLGRRTWELQSTCVRRGRFALGPVRVVSGDPFGLFRASRLVAPTEHVLVYPRVLDITRFGRALGDLPGGAVQGTRAPFTTPNVSTVRDYAPGDPYNRIHWASTARVGKLMVREFELDPTADVWLVLDMAHEPHAGSGNESTEEYAVTAAASLARYFLDRGRAVGLVSQPATLPVDRGPRQLERLLEVLAVAQATSALTLDALLAAEMGRFARSSSLVVITPDTAEDWVRSCEILNARGVRSTAVLVEADTFGPAPSPLLLVSTLAAAHVPVYLLKAGEPIATALAEAPRAGQVGL